MTKEILEDFYKRLVNQQDLEIFRSILDDYVGFIEENEKCNLIIEDMQNQKSELLEEKTKLKEKVLRELEKAKNTDAEVRKIVGVNVDGKNSKEFEDNFYYLVNKYFSESYPKLAELEREITKKQKLWNAWDGMKSKPYSVKECRQYLEKIHGYFLKKLGEENGLKDFSRKNESLKNDNDVVFRVKYSDVDRVIRVNDRWIAQLRLNGENDNVFNYIYRNPNKLLRINDKDEIAPGIMVGKALDDIVKNLKFFGEARRMFFPKVGDKEIEFRNPITLKELKDRGFNEDITEDELFPKKLKNKIGDKNG